MASIGQNLDGVQGPYQQLGITSQTPTTEARAAKATQAKAALSQKGCTPVNLEQVKYIQAYARIGERTKNMNQLNGFSKWVASLSPEEEGIGTKIAKGAKTLAKGTAGVAVASGALTTGVVAGTGAAVGAAVPGGGGAAAGAAAAVGGLPGATAISGAATSVVNAAAGITAKGIALGIAKGFAALFAFACPGPGWIAGAVATFALLCCGVKKIYDKCHQRSMKQDAILIRTYEEVTGKPAQGKSRQKLREGIKAQYKLDEKTAVELRNTPGINPKDIEAAQKKFLKDQLKLTHDNYKAAKAKFSELEKANTEAIKSGKGMVYSPHEIMTQIYSVIQPRGGIRERRPPEQPNRSTLKPALSSTNASVVSKPAMPSQTSVASQPRPTPTPTPASSSIAPQPASTAQQTSQPSMQSAAATAQNAAAQTQTKTVAPSTVAQSTPQPSASPAPAPSSNAAAQSSSSPSQAQMPKITPPTSRLDGMRQEVAGLKTKETELNKKLKELEEQFAAKTKEYNTAKADCPNVVWAALGGSSDGIEYSEKVAAKNRKEKEKNTAEGVLLLCKQEVEQNQKALAEATAKLAELEKQKR